MALSHSPSIVTDGLVLCLDAANLKSYPGTGVTWRDLTTNTNTGTLTNGPSFSPLNRGYISFDGSNDIVLVTSTPSIEIVGSLSISLWVYLNAGTNGNGIITKNSDYDYMLYFTDVGTTVIFYKKNSLGVASGEMAKATGLTLINVWSHITLTYNTNNGVSKIYKDGVLLATHTTSPPYDIRATTNALQIGQGFVTYTNGRIANVNIYNKELNSVEVLQNFNAIRGRFGI